MRQDGPWQRPHVQAEQQIGVEGEREVLDVLRALGQRLRHREGPIRVLVILDRYQLPWSGTSPDRGNGHAGLL